MKFAKYHGLGNDFIVLDSVTEKYLPVQAEALSKLARDLCNRRWGIGADGLLILRTSVQADFFMQIINSDGSEAQMCGNGIRCLVRYIHENGLSRKKVLRIETLSGLKIIEILKADDEYLIRVDMGEPVLACSQIPMQGEGERVIGRELSLPGGEKFVVTAVSMGNPHCVIFTTDLEVIPLETWGSALENHPAFPEKTNVEWVEVQDRQHLKMRVWERGAAETPACGTGACASLVAACLNNLSDSKAEVELAGGKLQITWEKNNRVYMEGSAQKVFTGEIFLDKMKFQE